MLTERLRLAGGPLVLAGFAVALVLGLPLQNTGDILALLLLSLAATYMASKIGPWAWVGALTHVAGSALYVFLTRDGASDARTYYERGEELSHNLDGVWQGVGTDAVYFLSAALQAALPVSILGLAWLGGAVILLLTPTLTNMPVSRNTFWGFYFLSPTIAFWSGLFSKDMLVLGATLASITAYGQLRNNRFLPWLFFVTLAGLLATLVRIYMVPVLLAPHAVVLMMMFLRRIRREGLGSLPAYAVFVVPALASGLLLAVSFTFSYVGVQGASQVDDRLNRLNQDLSVGGTAVEFTTVERILILFAPLPFRVRNVLDAVISFAAMLYLYFSVAYSMGSRHSRSGLDRELVIFSFLPLLAWTVIFSNAANFGLIDRMKAQVLPLLFLIISHLAMVGSQKKYVKDHQGARSNYENMIA